MAEEFASKDSARRHVWQRLEQQQLARPPLPAHGRIPNFVGSQLAAQRLFAEPLWRDAKILKVNPDSAQLAVRVEALRRGIVLLVPTPKLAAGFMRLDPARIDPADFATAAAHQTMARWAQLVALRELPQVDAIVTGCAAVTALGKRCGKGAGYSDLEFAVLQELGLQVRPVATTVHDIQIVGDFPIEANDIPLSLICTPTRTLRIAPHAPPTGIQWELLSDAQLRAMPILGELRQLRQMSTQR